MKPRWPATLIVALLLGCGDAPPDDDLPGPPQPFDAQRFATMEPGLYRSYLQLQDALAHDEFAAARKAAATLAGQAPDDQVPDDLAPLAQAAADASDITALREAFRPLSEMLIARDLPADMRVAYCPMAFNFEGGRWLQLNGDIANPYYGASMLRCGALEDPPLPPPL
ncbi:MAG: DUF3347 domain-containing protein [bacterium]|nr:DUF3347 domain-containing protein [bacterium]